MGIGGKPFFRKKLYFQNAISDDGNKAREFEDTIKRADTELIVKLPLWRCVEKGLSLRELDNWDIDEFSQYLAYLDMKSEIESEIMDTDKPDKQHHFSDKKVVMDWEGNVLNGK